MCGHLPPTSKTILIRRTRHAGPCLGSKGEHISDVLLWTPSCGWAGVSRPARTFLQQLCADTGCNLQDLPNVYSNSSSSLGLHFLYLIGYQSAQFLRRALHYARGGRQFLRQSAQPPWGSVYTCIHKSVYIYSLRCSNKLFFAMKVR